MGRPGELGIGLAPPFLFLFSLPGWHGTPFAKCVCCATSLRLTRQEQEENNSTLLNKSVGLYETMGKKQVTCPFCPKTLPLWWQTKGGKKRTGWEAMRQHVMDHHEDEAKRAGFFDDEEEPQQEEEVTWEDHEIDPDDRMAWETMQFFSGG